MQLPSNQIQKWDMIVSTDFFPLYIPVYYMYCIDILFHCQLWICHIFIWILSVIEGSRTSAFHHVYNEKWEKSQFSSFKDFFSVFQLVLNEKGFLSRNKTYTLHQGEGPIRSIKWRSQFIAWANDVVCYDNLPHCVHIRILYDISKWNEMPFY